MPLQDTLDEMRKSSESKRRPEDLSTMHNATEELMQSGIMDRVLKTGDRAPQFSLSDHNGDMVCSADLLSQGPLVVGFYRGVW